MLLGPPRLLGLWRLLRRAAARPPARAYRGEAVAAVGSRPDASSALYQVGRAGRARLPPPHGPQAAEGRLRRAGSGGGQPCRALGTRGSQGLAFPLAGGGGGLGCPLLAGRSGDRAAGCGGEAPAVRRGLRAGLRGGRAACGPRAGRGRTQSGGTWALSEGTAVAVWYCSGHLVRCYVVNVRLCESARGHSALRPRCVQCCCPCHASYTPSSVYFIQAECRGTV